MREYLKEKREKLIKEIPSLRRVIRGTLMEYYLPCGKKNCRCKKGFLHGPYYYLQVRTKGKNKMYYLPGSSLREKIKEAIEEYKNLRNLLYKVSEINIKLLKEEDKEWRKR